MSKNKRGYTLIESIVVIAIVFILGGITIGLSFEGVKDYYISLYNCYYEDKFDNALLNIESLWKSSAIVAIEINSSFDDVYTSEITGDNIVVKFKEISGNEKTKIIHLSNGKLMLNTPGDNKLISVIRSIYGKEIVENLIEINEEGSFCNINGYIGNNNIYRSNKNLQHIYINNRYVRSKIILDAINEAYKSIIPINKHGVCFLNIDINPAKIDVNIHPTKMEIKFENDKDLYIEIRDLLKKKLLNTALIGKYENYDDKFKVNESKETYLQEKEAYLQTFNNLNKENEEDKNLNKATPKNDFSELNSFMSLSEALSRNNKVEENKANKEKVKDNTITSNNIEKEIKLQSIENKKNEFFIDGVVDVSKSFSFDELNSLNEKNDKKAELNQISEENIKSENRFSITDFRVVGSILNTYIVLEKNEAMYLLDQHAAHEKVLYEEYMKKFKNHKIDMQMLLDPIVMEFSNVDMMKIENNMDLFLNFGFEIELFGNNHIMVRGVPTIFGTPESEKFILQIIDNMEDLSSSYDLKGDKFASMACRAAIKANDKIHIIEMKKLLLQMEKCENPFTCPHGRPTIVEISKKEIEKMFKRIM